MKWAGRGGEGNCGVGRCNKLGIFMDCLDFMKFLSTEDDPSEIGAETVDKDVDGVAEGIFILLRLMVVLECDGIPFHISKFKSSCCELLPSFAFGSELT
jgi:hypothetical protein